MENHIVRLEALENIIPNELIIAFIARDRPGVVEQVAEIVAEHGGNWLESRMAHLAETFTGVVRISLPDTHVANLKNAFTALEEDGFQIMVQDAGAAKTVDTPLLAFEIIGPDQPGILHELTRTIAKLGASVEEMETRIDSAPVSGEKLFAADTKVRLPEGLSEEAFQDALENSANALFVDLVIVDED